MSAAPQAPATGQSRPETGRSLSADEQKKSARKMRQLKQEQRRQIPASVLSAAEAEGLDEKDLKLLRQELKIGDLEIDYPSGQGAGQIVSGSPVEEVTAKNLRPPEEPTEEMRRGGYTGQFAEPQPRRPEREEGPEEVGGEEALTPEIPISEEQLRRRRPLAGIKAAYQPFPLEPEALEVPPASAVEESGMESPAAADGMRPDRGSGVPGGAAPLPGSVEEQQQALAAEAGRRREAGREAAGGTAMKEGPEGYGPTAEAGGTRTDEHGRAAELRENVNRLRRVTQIAQRARQIAAAAQATAAAVQGFFASAPIWGPPTLFVLSIVLILLFVAMLVVYIAAISCTQFEGVPLLSGLADLIVEWKSKGILQCP